jgi:hypothetical protein
MRKEAGQIIDDLGRYDRMRGWETLPEGAASLVGWGLGRYASPENTAFPFVPASGKGVVDRLFSAGARGAYTNLALDPVSQLLNVYGSGVQDELDGERLYKKVRNAAIFRAGSQLAREIPVRKVINMLWPPK